jgi:hypothetical protein
MARRIPVRQKRGAHFIMERARLRKRRRQKRSSAKRNGGRANKQRKKPSIPPVIFVCSKQEARERRLHRAHLRYRDGYLYLSWREGKRVRTHYFGRASRNYLKH